VIIYHSNQNLYYKWLRRKAAENLNRLSNNANIKEGILFSLFNNNNILVKLKALSTIGHYTQQKEISEIIKQILHIKNQANLDKDINNFVNKTIKQLEIKNLYNP
jgi:hypothetical protein